MLASKSQTDIEIPKNKTMKPTGARCKSDDADKLCGRAIGVASFRSVVDMCSLTREMCQEIGLLTNRRQAATRPRGTLTVIRGGNAALR